MALPAFTRMLLYMYSHTLRLDLTGEAEKDWLTLDLSPDDEDTPAMVEWQCEYRAVVRKKLLEDLEMEVSGVRRRVRLTTEDDVEADAYLKGMRTIKERRARALEQAAEERRIRERLLAAHITNPTQEMIDSYKYVDVSDDDEPVA